MKPKSEKLQNSWTLWLLAFSLIPLETSAQSFTIKRQSMKLIGDPLIGTLNVL